MSRAVAFVVLVVVVLLWGLSAFAQASRWSYQHRVDYFTRRVSDDLTARGHYIGALPASPDAGAPALTVSCFAGQLDAILISTGVTIDSQFGASPKVRTRIDNQETRWDRAAPLLRLDEKTLRLLPSDMHIGGTDMLFAKKFTVEVESNGARLAEMEFGIPSDHAPAPPILRPPPPPLASRGTAFIFENGVAHVVIPSGAKRSRGICISLDYSPASLLENARNVARLLRGEAFRPCADPVPEACPLRE
jgi:hypothetical protein